MVFVLSGTTRTANAAILTGIVLIIDDVKIDSPAVCRANQNNNHLAMRPTFIRQKPFFDSFGKRLKSTTARPYIDFAELETAIPASINPVIVEINDFTADDIALFKKQFP